VTATEDEVEVGGYELLESMNRHDIITIPEALFGNYNIGNIMFDRKMLGETAMHFFLKAA
jgi:hypothetical protein